MKKVFSFIVVMLFMGLTDSYADNEIFQEEIVVESIVQELNLKIINMESITDLVLESTCAEYPESTCSEYADAIAGFVAAMGGDYYGAWFNAFGVCIGELL